jgi:glycosyltransferase involved in cell wall biosynthesis
LTTVTVIVACRNENKHIQALLDSLAGLDRADLTLEAIIADGMSSDGTREMVAEFARSNRWCVPIDNPGRIVSTGLNRALDLATGEFIVRMDAHTTYEPEYVRRSISVLLETGADNAGGPQRSRASGYWQRAIRAGFHSPFASGGARFRDESYRGPVDTAPYGCWRRSFLTAMGGFDEALVRNQDDELNLRIRLAGGTVWQDPSIVSWYAPRASLAGLFNQQLQFGFWRVAVLRKHPGAGSIRHLIPGAAALVGLALAAMIATNTQRRAAGAVLAVLAGAYLALSASASVRSASRDGWDLLPALPLTFAAYQLAYAAGFLAGLVYWTVFSGRKRENPRAVSGARPHDSG